MPDVSPPGRRGHGNGGRALGRRAVALTFAVASVLGVAAGAVASRVSPRDASILGAEQEGGSTPQGPITPTAQPPGTSAAPTPVPTTTAEPATPAAPPTTTGAPSPTPSEPPPPLSQSLLTQGDWRRAGLSAPVPAGARRTLSRCQDTSLGSMSGVRSTRYAAVTSGAVTGAQAVAETRTPAQAEALLRAVVAWRESCNPSGPNRAYLGTSTLIRTPVEAPGDAPGEAYRWTFVFDTTADYGNSLLEEVIVGRRDNRVAVVVVSREVPVATARTIAGVDTRSLALTATARLT